MGMGSIGQLVAMIPGLDSNLLTKDKEKESTAKVKRFLTAMDSMTKEELDSEKPLCEKRIKRIARGAGVHPAEIHFLIGEHKKFSGMIGNVSKMAGLAGGNVANAQRNP